MKLIIHSLIENNHLTLEKLNHRITSFDYGFADKRNKPSVISNHGLRNMDGAMRQSARSHGAYFGCCPSWWVI